MPPGRRNGVRALSGSRGLGPICVIWILVIAVACRLRGAFHPVVLFAGVVNFNAARHPLRFSRAAQPAHRGSVARGVQQADIAELGVLRYLPQVPIPAVDDAGNVSVNPIASAFFFLAPAAAGIFFVYIIALVQPEAVMNEEQIVELKKKEVKYELSKRGKVADTKENRNVRRAKLKNKLRKK